MRRATIELGVPSAVWSVDRTPVVERDERDGRTGSEIPKMSPGHRHPTGVARALLGAAVVLLVGASFAGVVVPPESASASGPTVVIDYPFGFTPASVKIRVGQTVTWVNKEPIAHGVIPLNGGFTGRSSIAPGKSYTAKFSKRGTFSYRDSYNQLWTGTVVVGSSTATTTAPKATPKPTAKPTAKATPKPTAKATPKAAASATPATVALASEPPNASPPPVGAGTVAGGSGGSSGSGAPSPLDPADDGFGLGAILAMIGLIGLAFAGGALLASNRRRQDALPLVADVGPAAPMLQVAAPYPTITPSGGSAVAGAGAGSIATPPPPPADARYQMPGDVVEDEPLQNARPPGSDDAEDE